MYQYAEYRKAVNFVKKYVEENGKNLAQYDFKWKSIFCNEFENYVIRDSQFGAFIEKQNVELNEELMFSFYIPSKYDLFSSLMKMLD